MKVKCVLKNAVCDFEVTITEYNMDEYEQYTNIEPHIQEQGFSNEW